MYACYDGEGNISVDGVRRLVRHYAAKGVRGLYIGGSSGEGMLQTKAERMLVLEAAMAEAEGSGLTIIAHVGAASTRESVELAIHAEKAGAHAISAVPSIYYRVSPESVEAHWQAMIDSTSLPFIIYHIPQTTGFQLSTQLLAKMAQQDKVIGVKISSESTYELQQFKAAGGSDFLVFNGPDEQYLAGRSIGADGGIGGTYGVMPEMFLKLEACYKEGRIEEAREWQFRINEVIRELLSFPSLYGACKALLKLEGIDCGEPRLPLLPVRTEHCDRIERLHETIQRYAAEARPSLNV